MTTGWESWRKLDQWADTTAFTRFDSECCILKCTCVVFLRLRAAKLSVSLEPLSVKNCSGTLTSDDNKRDRNHLCFRIVFDVKETTLKHEADRHHAIPSSNNRLQDSQANRA